MTRPYVICHMSPSIDGRIVTAKWGLLRRLSAEYERTAQTFDADAWIIGRISMEPYAGKTRVPHGKVRRRIPRNDFIADSDAESYAIAIARSAGPASSTGRALQAVPTTAATTALSP